VRVCLACALTDTKSAAKIQLFFQIHKKKGKKIKKINILQRKVNNRENFYLSIFTFQFLFVFALVMKRIVVFTGAGVSAESRLAHLGTQTAYEKNTA
jgi:hypothetical protein